MARNATGTIFNWANSVAIVPISGHIHALGRSHAGVKRRATLAALHPTVKPVALVADAMLDCTARRDIVLDGFLGSGTTVIAAERTGRRCYGIELDPLYVDVIVRRWQNFTRRAALHAHTSKSFDETQAERARGR